MIDKILNISRPNRYYQGNKKMMFKRIMEEEFLIKNFILKIL